MVGGGDSTPSDGPGGRASKFLDAVVVFVVAIFQPVFHVFVSFISPSNSQPPHQQRDDNDNNNNTNANANLNTATATATMQQQVQNLPTVVDPSLHSSNPKEVNENRLPAVNKAIQPHINSPNGVAKQDILSANGVAPTNNDRELADVTNGARFRAVNEEQAEENRHEQLTLPPIVQPIETQDGNEGKETEEEEELEDPVKAAERAIHQGFINQALDMARLSLRTNETPVGCVLVHDGRVIAKGMNATNITRNGTRHAELMALTALLSYTPNSDIEGEKSKSKPPMPRTYTDQEWGDVDPSDGHIYPYGQKLHPAPHVDRSLIQESTLYVTVEPCVMCASMLRQFGIKKVYFGAVNDKFGGTGGVFCIHMNSDPAHTVTTPAPVPYPRATILHKPASSAASSVNGSQEDSSTNGGDAKSVNGIVFVEPPIPVSNTSVGHGGNVEDGFEAEGGWGRDEAVNLLRQFYVQENGRAPVPRKKEGRAARLAAMMESQGMKTEGTALEGLAQQEREAVEGDNATTTSETKLDQEVEDGRVESDGPGIVENAQSTEPPHREEATA